MRSSSLPSAVARGSVSFFHRCRRGRAVNRTAAPSAAAISSALSTSAAMAGWPLADVLTSSAADELPHPSVLRARSDTTYGWSMLSCSRVCSISGAPSAAAAAVAAAAAAARGRLAAGASSSTLHSFAEARCDESCVTCSS